MALASEAAPEIATADAVWVTVPDDTHLAAALALSEDIKAFVSKANCEAI